MAKKIYDTRNKRFLSSLKEGKPVAKDIYTLLGKKFPLTIYSDGKLEYDDKDLTEFENTQLQNYLTNL